MHFLWGTLRLGAMLLVVVCTLLLMPLAALWPQRTGQASAPLWLVVAAARLFVGIFRLRVVCPDVARLRAHRGFIFMNHLSYIEPLALLSLAPVRFLAAVELRQRPAIGWISQQVGTIFVERGDAASRSAARESVAAELRRSDRPPLVVFPEGRLGLGQGILPFRYGIFETAIAAGCPYLLCALAYHPADVAIWRGGQGETLLAAIWRLATFPGPVTVEIEPLQTVQPQPGDEPQALAEAARQAIAQATGLPALPPDA